MVSILSLSIYYIPRLSWANKTKIFQSGSLYKQYAPCLCVEINQFRYTNSLSFFRKLSHRIDSLHMANENSQRGTANNYDLVKCFRTSSDKKVITFTYVQILKCFTCLSNLCLHVTVVISSVLSAINNLCQYQGNIIYIISIRFRIYGKYRSNVSLETFCILMSANNSEC